MKTVLYFIPEFPRISETFIEREVAHLLNNPEIDLHVFSLQKASGSTSAAVLKKTTYKRLKIKHLPRLFVFFVKNVHKLPLLINLASGPDRLSYLRRYWHVIKSFGYAMFFSEFSPDHIHAHFFSEPSNIAMFASKILNVPFSVSAHARDIFVDATLLPIKAKEAKFVAICNQRAWGRALELVGNEYRHKLHMIYHGIDHEKIFSFPPSLDKPAKPVIFLGGTRLVEKKGIKYVIEASKLLKERGIDHVVNLVGPGPLFKELSELITHLGLEDTVIIHGGGNGTPFAVVADHYKIADIFVFPSFETGEGDMDGVPTVVIEASMAKLPIITTNAGSISDLITRENGIIIPQKNSQAIANAIEELLLNPELRESLGKKAYEKAVKMFDINKNISTLASYFLQKTKAKDFC
ncbi:MAG: glycosyltransferase family 4 protein [Patescibacteria group bacterium]